MKKIDENKLAKLSTTNQMLDEKYGVHGTASRNEFDIHTIGATMAAIAEAKAQQEANRNGTLISNSIDLSSVDSMIESSI